MTRATAADTRTVVDILSESFSSDPYLAWLQAGSRNPAALRILMDYVVDETLERGEIWLAGDGAATALWHGRAEPVTPRFIVRNVWFFLRMGLRTTARTLRMESAIHACYPKTADYLHLYLIGVREGHRGKGLASALIDPVLKRMDAEGRPVVLETANPTNVAIYERKGFVVTATIDRPGIAVYVMERQPGSAD